MAFFKRKKFASEGRRRASIPDGLWMKCEGCRQTVYRSDVEENHFVCPNCSFHYRISARRRVELVVDAGSFDETHRNIETVDALHFAVGGETYADRIERAKRESGLTEAIITGFASIEGTRTALGAMESAFIMASMGSALGEKFCRLVRDAIREEVPLIVFCASGGARMQEGILALMQMAKTADAVRQLNEAGLPYITVLTDPTSGGVFASFASLGDIVLAEPGAYIGFAGARLIEGALRLKLPEGFQRAEYQFDNGFVDQVVNRADLRPLLGRLLRYLAPQPATQI
ncbi:MAG: acetyl-CoA carboxylase carboxyltransferase subunit beta [Candidatus Hydrogenedentes bacterium]|nr:acetyl-CoA carboxylase carboxyltransferase subunit beta [Candidatus Hydrogenedentota bacterium]